ncbi:MAG: hypothetical protein WED33_06180 [Bacteroidia bacterium]
MMKNPFSIAGIIFLIIFSACKKEENEYGPEPQITFKSISPVNVEAYADSVVINIEYTDGDGDLGENVSGVENAFITDLRTSLEYGLRIRQLGPDNSNIIIRGNLSLVIPAVGITSGSSSPESATFEVRIRDRAGNFSNKVTTTAITVNP